MRIKIKKAFTLAEVLITLGIIGIVAAITIPTLMKNTQDQEFKSAWKKQYSVFSQATMSILNENGGTFKNIATTYDHQFLRDLYLNKIKPIKICDNYSTWGQCWTPHVLYGNGTTKYLNGGDLTTGNIPLGDGDAGAVLSDGTFVIFAYQDSTCTALNSIGNGYESITNVCGWISVDVNGAKGPNLIGRDIFGMFVLENKVVPYGTKTFASTCNTSSTGLGCSALYLKQ